MHSKGKKLAADVDLDNIAKRMPFSTGAELENVMNEAAILAARGRKTEIDQQLLVDAIARVQMGPEKRSHKVNEKDKRLVATHESGHALVGHLLPGCDEVHLITIVPRGQAAGHTLSLPAEEHDNMSRSQMMDQVCMCLGGHAAEQVVLGEIYTGSSSDLKRATELCRRMVTMYGMSDEVGTMYLANDQEVFVGMEFGQSRDYSEEVAAQIDREVKRLLAECYAKAVKLLEDHRKEMDNVVNALLAEDTLSRKEFVALMNGEKLPARRRAIRVSPQPTPEIPPQEEKPVTPPEKPPIPDGVIPGMGQMTACMKADLHVHTTYSDGTWTPRRRSSTWPAATRGMAVLAITDHDALAAAQMRCADAALPVARDSRRGAEHFRIWRGLHLLGYGAGERAAAPSADADGADRGSQGTSAGDTRTAADKLGLSAILAGYCCCISRAPLDGRISHRAHGGEGLAGFNGTGGLRPLSCGGRAGLCAGKTAAVWNEALDASACNAAWCRCWRIRRCCPVEEMALPMLLQSAGMSEGLHGRGGLSSRPAKRRGYRRLLERHSKANGAARVTGRKRLPYAPASDSHGQIGAMCASWPQTLRRTSMRCLNALGQ